MKRLTRQRTVIQRVIEEARRPLSPAEILDAGRQQLPSLSIATVYRNLRDLQKDGLIKTVPLPGENTRYESHHADGDGHHHHHFQCTHCQKVFDIHGCPGGLEQMAPEGFAVEHHELILYGLCSECNNSRPPDAIPAARAIGARPG